MTRMVMLVLVCGLGAGSALADAESDFEMLFGAEAKKVAATPSKADDAAFASKLLAAGKSLGDAPALQALVYEKAYAFGIKHRASYARALEALELWGKVAPDQVGGLQAKRLDLLRLQYEASHGEARKAVAKRYLDLLLSLADAGAAGGNAVEANALYVKAFPIASYLRSPRASEIVRKRRALAARLAAARKREAKLESLQARLRKDPKDTKARTELVLLFLLEDDNPKEAVKLVTNGLAESFRTYLPLAAKPVKDLPKAACMELGAWYEQLAAKAVSGGKATALRRAAACYRQYLAVHARADAAGLKARMSLAKVEKVLAKLQAARPGKRARPKTLTLALSRAVAMKLVLIPAGTFVMGSPKDEPGREVNEGPQHEVTIARPFYMGIYAVTQEQYVAVMGKNPSTFKGAKNPVGMVSWHDAVAFCNKLSAKTGRVVRLPTEAEREYACRAGTKTRFSFGNDEKRLGDYAWFTGNSGGKTHPVGLKKPNPWGLYGMHGNVREWCQDRWHDNYEGAPDDGSAWQDGDIDTPRVLRGRSWGDPARCCRSAFRGRNGPGNQGRGLGFRVMCSVVLGVD